MRLLELGNAVLARLDLREIARAHLVALVEETGETATCRRPGSTRRSRSTSSRARPRCSTSPASGARASPTRLRSARSILAFGGKLPDGPCPIFTERTITERAALHREVALVAERGFAEALGERENDLNAIAAPIRGGQGDLAGILGVQGPAARFTAPEMQRALRPLLAHAAAISASSATAWNRLAPDPRRPVPGTVPGTGGNLGCP